MLDRDHVNELGGSQGAWRNLRMLDRTTMSTSARGERTRPQAHGSYLRKLVEYFRGADPKRVRAAGQLVADARRAGRLSPRRFDRGLQDLSNVGPQR